MCKRILTMMLFAAVFSGQIFSATIEEYMEKLKYLDPDVLKKLDKTGMLPAECKDKNGKPIEFPVWETMKAMLEESRFQKRLRGKSSIGFRGDENGYPTNYRLAKVDVFNLNTGLELKRGWYPGEFKFEANLKLRLSEGEFDEDVTAIQASYDHYSKEWLESYVFASRFSDNFLNIDQRYEIGFGVFFGRTFDSPGRKEVKPYSKFLDTNEKKSEMEEMGLGIVANENPQWYKCYCEIVKEDKIEILEIKQFREDLKEDLQSMGIAQKKRNDRLRIGIAGSLMTEMEKATIKWIRNENIIRANGAEEELPFTEEITLDSTQKYRYSLRPTLEYQPSEHWKFKLHWYWKLPLNAFKEDKIQADGSLIRAYDYRSDLYASIDYKVKAKEVGQPGDVGITFKYERFYDNTPPIGKSNITSELIAAPHTHQMFGLDFSINW